MLEANGLTETVGGKHVVKMTKPGRTPITLPHDVWGLEHGTEAYAVLNACRAQGFLTDGRIVSKVAGGSAALARGLGPPAVIGRALAQQQGQASEQDSAADAVGYILAAVTALRSAAGAAGSA